MGFGFRVAPGLRLSASRRGIRAGIGPRATRVHVGSGGLGFSTGAGPVTFFTGASGRRRQSPASGTSKSALKAYQRQVAEAQRIEQIDNLRRALERLINAHRDTFPKAEPPVLPPVKGVDEVPIRTRIRKIELSKTKFWQFRERKQARLRADVLAQEEISTLLEQRSSERERAQKELDMWWQRLTSNEAETVISALDNAFEDNEIPAVPVNVEGDHLTLVTLAPGDEDLPQREPTITPAGRLSVKKMTKTNKAKLYITMVCSHALATMREALAVASGIQQITLIIARAGEPDIYGEVDLIALLAGRYTRTNLDRVDWKRAHAPDIMQHAADDLIVDLGGRVPTLRKLDLSQRPDLASFMAALKSRWTGPASHDST